MSRRKSYVFWQETFKVVRFLLSGIWSLPAPTVIFEVMNTLIEERHNHSENCITVKASRRTQKVEIYIANERSGLAFLITDLGHYFGSHVGGEFGVMLKGRGPHKPEFAYGIVRIHSLMIYTDLIEYKIVGDTKAPLLRCFHFISKLKSEDIIITGQYMNYQTFSNLQFRPLLKSSFHSVHIDLRDTSVEKIPFVSVGITRLVLMFRKASTFIFNLKDVTRWLHQDKQRFHSIEVSFDNVDGDLVRLNKLLGELQFHFCVNLSFPLQNA